MPQHFNTYGLGLDDGHYTEGNNHSDCNQTKKWKIPGQLSIQNYNNATDRAFAKYCNSTNHLKEQQSYYASRYEHECTVNQTSLEYPRTVYNYLKENNCTKRLERFTKEGGSSLTTGTILRWNIADLFDVPQWHHGDCSHFCYVMPVYEAAFERLLYLLPSL